MGYINWNMSHKTFLAKTFYFILNFDGVCYFFIIKKYVHVRQCMPLSASATLQINYFDVQKSYPKMFPVQKVCSNLNVQIYFMK